MANFKVGQRVKKVAMHPGVNDVPLGSVGTIAGTSRAPGDMRWLVDYDCMPKLHLAAGYNAADYMLAPLTDDPGAWAADAVRKVTKPQHIEPAAPAREYAESGEREI